MNSACATFANSIGIEPVDGIPDPAPVCHVDERVAQAVTVGVAKWRLAPLLQYTN